MKKIFFILVFFSCSHLESNKVFEGVLHLRGGKGAGQQWDQSLIFKRISWYNEITLLYDILYTKISKDSPFFNWFSEDEKRSLQKCSKSFIVMSYELDNERLSHSLFDSFVDNSGFEKMALVTFRDTIKIHPDFRRHAFHLYEVFALCSSSHTQENILIDFPNFDQKIMD